PAMQRDNVTLETRPIERITSSGLITNDGVQHEVDCIVFATGFKSWDFLAPMTVLGREGKSLKDVWGDAPSAYLGMAIPQFPNLFLLYGPNTNLGHNSITFMLECQVHYVMKCIARMRKRKLCGLEVSAGAMTRYETKMLDEMQRTAWAGGCDSWYKRPDGRVINNWPTHTVAYWLRTRRPRWADFDAITQ
ncbi:MAG: 4-hydroxyacetophenone monooxygenase, partial [Pseudomonadota bacterium]